MPGPRLWCFAGLPKTSGPCGFRGFYPRPARSERVASRRTAWTEVKPKGFYWPRNYVEASEGYREKQGCRRAPAACFEQLQAASAVSGRRDCWRAPATEGRVESRVLVSQQCEAHTGSSKFHQIVARTKKSKNRLAIPRWTIGTVKALHRHASEPCICRPGFNVECCEGLNAQNASSWSF